MNLYQNLNFETKKICQKKMPEKWIKKKVAQLSNWSIDHNINSNKK